MNNLEGVDALRILIRN